MNVTDFFEALANCTSWKYLPKKLAENKKIVQLNKIALHIRFELWQFDKYDFVPHFINPVSKPFLKKVSVCLKLRKKISKKIRKQILLSF